jgi:hypothetical protein
VRGLWSSRSTCSSGVWPSLVSEAASEVSKADAHEHPSDLAGHLLTADVDRQWSSNP